MAKTRAEKKTARAQKAGYTGKNAAAAQASVVRQYGLTKNAAGKWVKPDAAFLQTQMTAQGWGPEQTAATPVNIGGARWLFGAGDAQFTGQRSDSAKRNPGAAYDAAEQAKYRAAGLKGNGKSMAGVTNDSIASSAGGVAAGIYAEGDTSRTGTAAAQGKAWEAIFGTDAGTVLGATSVPSVAQESAGEAEGGTGGGKKKPHGKKGGKKRTSTKGRRQQPRGKK